tara:strand:- start:366 stop:623 length:258 start_codon:yes stop_codon:yes gene_type:complete
MSNNNIPEKDWPTKIGNIIGRGIVWHVTLLALFKALNLLNIETKEYVSPLSGSCLITLGIEAYTYLQPIYHSKPPNADELKIHPN